VPLSSDSAYVTRRAVVHVLVNNASGVPVWVKRITIVTLPTRLCLGARAKCSVCNYPRRTTKLRPGNRDYAFAHQPHARDIRLRFRRAHEAQDCVVRN